MTSKYLTYKEVATMLGVPVGTLYAMVFQKRIPHIRLGPRFVRFSQEAIMVWLGRHQVEDDSKNALNSLHGAQSGPSEMGTYHYSVLGRK